MKRYYCPRRDMLVYLDRKADPNFWDTLWSHKMFLESITEQSSDRLVVPETLRYLNSGDRVLEGGCGSGKYVYQLIKNGFKARGVDNAKKTIDAIKKIFPDLPVRFGDVRKLPFAGKYFDGYWSVGVIEHFFQGFGSIAKEMSRVLKANGYLFITFPQISPVRRLKVRWGFYPEADFQTEPNGFYQFALSPSKVIPVIEAQGFIFIRSRPFDGYKGLKEEVPLREIFRFIDRSAQSHKTVKMLKSALSWLMIPFFAHSTLFLFRKEI